jgi:hypothetical protein
MELYVSWCYEAGRLHEKKGDSTSACDYYLSALSVMKKLGSHHVINRYADSITLKMPRHPILLLILNRLSELFFRASNGYTSHLVMSTQVMAYASIFAELWGELPFCGDKKARKKQFGRNFPLPLSILCEARGGRLFVDHLGKYLSFTTEYQDETTRAWNRACTLLNFLFCSLFSFLLLVFPLRLSYPIYSEGIQI